MEIDLSKAKKVYFIGIGGIGISALAKMVLALNMQASGINDEESGKTIDSLRALGVEIDFLSNFTSVPEADMYIYSDAWPFRGPEVIQSARDTGKPVLSYFEALGEFAKKYKVIAISGTHGKTTTTAMVGEILIDAGLDPTIVVGSFVKKFGSNFRKGGSEYLVVEADEFNRHMLYLYPYIGVITNIEADHLDVYKDLDEIKTAFNQFVSQCEHIVTDYSKYMNKVPKLLVPGDHNRMNAAAALAVAELLGIEETVAQKSLAEFAGTWRRLEKKGVTPEGTIIYDDYAHHPTEVRASLSGLKELYPDKRITVLFQPHLYSRTKALFDEFVNCFDQADQVYLLPIYFAREAPDPEISSEILAQAIQDKGVQVIASPDFASAEDTIKALSLKDNDVFVTMGAGEAYKVAEKVFKLL
ncbi:MAG: Mur ligase family protein [bacterium]|nr:Mur ligase family protein [bacterium]